MAAPRLPALEWGAWRTPFVFFTGKGGVGKTTVASSVAVALADAGRRVLVVSTDPASNLADVFGTAVRPQRSAVPGVPGLARVGPNFVVSGRAGDGLVEAIEDPSRTFALGVQWHPEEDEASRLIASLVARVGNRDADAM